MSHIQHNLFGKPFPVLFEKVKCSVPSYYYNFKRHSVVLQDQNKEDIGYIRLPLAIELAEDLEVLNEEAQVLYVSIESGNAAICVMEGGENVFHTTFSAYMTRKKQGFSQIKYLNKKGKSRAGSRVRLASTIEFFENINETLIELFEEFEFDRIAIDCSPVLIPYLHQSKVECPFDKKDERLYKIPLDIPQSNYSSLNKAINKLKAPILFCDEYNSDVVRVFQEE